MDPKTLGLLDGASGGALVVSLDFELAWGMLDVADVDGAWKPVGLGARDAIPRMLDRFAVTGIAATWATVGLLFAESREEALAFAPRVRPHYRAPLVNPYEAWFGDDEVDDPLRFAPSLVRLIASYPHQEIASHSFGHFTALEDGHDEAAFEADVKAAVAIAKARGIALRSWVWPRHQVRREWIAHLAKQGFRAHRGPPQHPWYAAAKGRQGGPWTRMGRLQDAYLPLTGDGAHPWSSIETKDGVVNVPESRFLRGAYRQALRLEPLRISRITRAMEQAAAQGTILHVWWHPHNFGTDADANFRALDTLLATYERLRDTAGMTSLSMAGVADRVAGSRAVLPISSRSSA